MPATTITIEEDTPYPFTRFRVYTSPSVLNADWTEQDFLRPESLSMVAGPDIDQCSLRLDVGFFPHRNDSPFGMGAQSILVEPLDIDRQYVKIEILDDNDEVADIWVGRIAYEEQDVAVRQVFIDDDENATNVKTGTQRFVAYGLMWEWENTFIASSFVRVRDTEDTIDPERGIPFNYVDRAGGYVLRGNRDFVFLGDGAPVFSWEPTSDDKWNATDAINYLQTFFPPKTPAGNPAIVINQTGAILDWYDISVETDRRSVKAILDELVDRRRLAGYYLKPKEVGSSIFCDLILFTFTDETLDIGDDTIPANSDQVELTCRSNAITTSAVLRSVATHVADRVIVEGAYITSTFTSRFFDDIAEGWSSIDESFYKLGAGGDADETANTFARSRDELKDVYSRFVIWYAWEQQTFDNFAITIQPEGIPDDLDDGDVAGLFNEPLIHNPWRHRAARFLDYIAIQDENTGEFRRPFVIFPESQIEGNDDAWVYADQANVGDRQFACHLHMLHDQLGFQLTVNRAGGNSLLASNDYGGANATPDELDPENEGALAFNYETMRFTGTVEWDDRVSAQVTINGSGDGTERLRRIMIGDARLDFVLPQTVTDLSQSGSRVLSTGQVLRDDRARLRTIAEAAALWYGTPRKAATITYNSMRQLVSIGQLLTSFTDNGLTEDVMTPITGIAINFVEGTTTIETSYAEIDFSTNRAGV